MHYLPHQRSCNKNLTVISICTDNARNEQAILNPLHSYSLQTLTGLSIVRLSCVVHNANMALQNFLQDQNVSILKSVTRIINKLSTSAGSDFQNLPRYDAGRWLSYGAVIQFFNLHFLEIQNYLMKNNFESEFDLLHSVGFPEICQIFILFRHFINSIEGNSI
jgi:hypothetical protein